MQHPAAQRLRDKTLVASLRNRYERQPDASVLLTAAGRLWLAGIEVSAGRPMAGTGEDQ
jgi:phthiocerol/phenolphthiocerol synthesis type-I polyketide synthase E